jgi:hypothetical protein
MILFNTIVVGSPEGTFHNSRERFRVYFYPNIICGRFIFHSAKVSGSLERSLILSVL